MKKLIHVFTIILLGSIFSPAQAELLINPAFIYDTKESGVEMFLGKSYTKYSAPLGFIGKTDNTYFSGSYVYGFGRHLNLYGSAAFILDNSLEASGSKTNGDGLAFGIGFKGEYPQFNYEGAIFSWYTQILKQDLDFDDKTEGDLFEITAGFILKKEIRKGIIGYAGLEYIVNSDVTVGVTDYSDEEDANDIYGYEFEDDDEEDEFLSEIDGERKDKLGIKLGLIFPMEKYNVFVDAGLMNEFSLKVGINFPFGASRSVAKHSDYSNHYSNEIQKAQQKLYELGYKPGPIDGVAGNRFEEALRKFQNAWGLRETGTLNSATSNALGL